MEDFITLSLLYFFNRWSSQSYKLEMSFWSPHGGGGGGGGPPWRIPPYPYNYPYPYPPQPVPPPPRQGSFYPPNHQAMRAKASKKNNCSNNVRKISLIVYNTFSIPDNFLFDLTQYFIFCISIICNKHEVLNYWRINFFIFASYKHSSNSN